MRQKFGRGALCALAVCLTMGVAHADLIDLGTLGGATSQAWGIQADGRVVVGVSDNGSGQQAFVYTVNAGFTGGVMTGLTSLGGSASEARAINASGLIVGYSQDGGGVEQAVTWTGVVPTAIANTAGGTGARAFGVSTVGEVVGWANDSSGVQRAFVTSGGVMTALDLTSINSQHDPTAGHNARALGISADGRFVVGEFEVDNGSGSVEVHGFVYDRVSPASSYELSGGGVGSARASNASFAVGAIYNGTSLMAGFSTHGTGSADYLPSLGSTSGVSNAINSFGASVGSETLVGVGQVATFWDAASVGALVTNLDALYGTSGTLNEATGIADVAGIYSGWGTFGGQTHGFLLNTASSATAPEPSSVALLTLGGTLVVLRRRRCNL